jgi:hypothetical protein
VLITVAALGLTLVRLGTREVAPPPAPLPTSAFAEQRLQPLPPGANVPRAGSTAALTSEPAGVGASGGTGSGGLGRAGPWTFADRSHLYIESLGTSAPIVDAPIQGRQLVGPGDVRTVGRWLGGAGLSSSTGTVDLAGHVNYIGQGAGALSELYRIAPGAVVVTTDSAGVRTPWRVTSLQTVAKDALPTSLFSPTGPRLLKIITCGGALIKEPSPSGTRYSYVDNVIVTAAPL